MGQEAYEDYRRAIHDPGTVHAMCEDYRAGLTVDRAADDADHAAGRRHAIDSGHHVAEEAPEQLAESLLAFLRP